MNMLDEHDQATADDLVARLSHITLDRPTPEIAVLAPKPARRSRWLAAAAAVAVVVSGVTLARPSNSDSVSAGWTPVPRAAQPGETEHVIDVCNQRTKDADQQLPSDTFGPNTIIEFRGSIALAITERGDSIVRCTARQQGTDAWYAFGIGESQLSNSEPLLSGGGGPDFMAWFVHGADERAARVNLTVPGYPVITATVVNGTYTAWWPDERNAGADDLPQLRIDIFDRNDQLVDTITW